MTPTLHLGRWQDVLADVEADAVIADCPFSARTHDGHDSAPTVAVSRKAVGSYQRTTHQVASAGAHRAGGSGVHRDGATRRALSYAGWSAADVRAFVESWSPRCSGWMVIITDHVLAPLWDAAMAAAGRYVYAPLPWFAPGSRVRLTGDGPSSWTCWIVVGRPSRDLRVSRNVNGGTFRDGTPWHKWGTLPGGYVCTTDRESHIGGKPLALMRAIVLDYSRPGDLVVDPTAGGGTTLLAAAIEGRRSIGAELDPETYEKARQRLASGWTPTFRLPDAGVAPVPLSLDLAPPTADPP